MLRCIIAPPCGLYEHWVYFLTGWHMADGAAQIFKTFLDVVWKVFDLYTLLLFKY